MRAFMLNGDVRDQSSPLFMNLGDTALIEVFVEGVGTPGDRASGLGVFDFTVLYDSQLLSISNPNKIVDRRGNVVELSGKEFRPLRPHSFAPDLQNDTFDCEDARGGVCNDSTDFLTSTGRTVINPLVEPFPTDGQFRLSLGTADLTANKSLLTPTGGGVLAVFEIEFINGFTATALADGSSPTELALADIVLGTDSGAEIFAQGSGLAINAVPLPGSGLALLGALGVLGYRARSRAAARK
jgi:hypothetical protein